MAANSEPLWREMIELPEGGMFNGVKVNDTTGVRYVDDPTPEELEEVKAWIRKESANYEDPFDMSVECAIDLGIYNLDQLLWDRCQDRAIPYFISDLTAGFFDGEWE